MTPDPPGNVRLVFGADVVPVDCTYEGWDGETHVWVVINPREVMPGRVMIDRLPAHTSVVVSGV